MTIFNVLSLIGGLCLFLFGMDLMGKALERRAGSKLRVLLGKFTTNKFAGLLTGLVVTAIIQSSSATTVMVVGFVNSSLMSLSQAINVIMGANIGTTVTAWILSLGGISSSNVFVQLLKPMSFTPVLALIGIIFNMFGKSTKRKDTGIILLGFATLMFGMDAMTDAVSVLKTIPEFREMFVMFSNPVLGVLVGAILTAIIQSSSASVGILQALSATGAVTYGAAIPIIMGQNIGTCITAILSSFGANKNAKRAALVHLSFNIIGSLLCLVLFVIVNIAFAPALFNESATHMGIAVAHSVFNVFCTLALLPMSKLLEKLVIKLVPDSKKPEAVVELDERLLATPAIALERCRAVAVDMAKESVEALKLSLKAVKEYTPELAEAIREKENRSDHYEDILGTYLVKLSVNQSADSDGAEEAELLKLIGDFERISDHAVNILESAEELRDKELELTKEASEEFSIISAAVDEILTLTLKAFTDGDFHAANSVEPLEQVIDGLKESMRTRHIKRLQQGNCSIDTGFVWNDMLSNLERTSDHCSNIAGCVVDVADNNLNIHESLRNFKKDSEEFKSLYNGFAEKYKFA